MFMNEPRKLVSIVVPFFNAERFFEETIASIFAQTYSHWELLLVDDGSTDRSQTIAQNYAREYPDRVRYLYHECRQNRGTSASRNLGIDTARGEYIAFLDADDVWLPQTLSRQVTILESQPSAAMVYGKCLFWHSWNERLDADVAKYDLDYFIPLGLTANSLLHPSQTLLPFLQDRIQQPIPSCMMVRREVFTTIGRFDDEFRYHLEDRILSLKILESAPIFVADEQWVKYRQHDRSWCAIAQKNDLIFEAQQAYLNWVTKYLGDRGIIDRQVWQAIQQQKIRYCHPIFYYLSDLQAIAVRLGRLIFPKKLRHWLWITFSNRQVVGSTAR
jgi:glycosyltransferase involved in cell wall biosynthesis